MPFETLRTKVVETLISRDHPRATMFKHAENLAELHSCLREYVFTRDHEVAAFLKEVREGIKTPTPA